jgi:hypothetical protein
VTGLRILITNMSLATRSGTESYVRDLALGLRRRGHTPVVYSTFPGEPADELRAATVPVVDNLADLAVVPDIIHGHHHPETVTALVRFPGVPAVFCCHSWLSERDAPPHFERIRRYVAVDDTCRDRLLHKCRIPASRLALLRNAVDLDRFPPRGPLPEQPARALVFSHYASEHTHLPAVRAACVKAGLQLDVMGLASGAPCARPETVLREYDLVFAKARCALEAMAVGAAVVLCDSSGVGPMVTSAEFPELRCLNFGLRTLSQAVTPEAIGRQIARFSASDAQEVTRQARATAGLEQQIDDALALYEDVIREHLALAPADEPSERTELADYLRTLTSVREMWAFQEQTHAAQCAAAAVRAERDHLQTLVAQTVAEREEVRQHWEALHAEYTETLARFQEQAHAYRCMAEHAMREQARSAALAASCKRASANARSHSKKLRLVSKQKSILEAELA